MTENDGSWISALKIFKIPVASGEKPLPLIVMIVSGEPLLISEGETEVITAPDGVIVRVTGMVCAAPLDGVTTTEPV